MARISHSETEIDVAASEIAMVASGRTAITDEPDFGPVAPGTPISGFISPGSDLDYYTLNVVAGQSYVISLNGTGATAMPDPQLFLYNSGGVAIAADDEGGTGSNALLTYTATYTGVVYVEAGAWSDASHAGIPGSYTLEVAQRGADVSNTLAGAQAVSVGSNTLSFMEQTGTTASTAFNDVDYFKVELVEGQYYEFQVSAGWDYYTGPESDLRMHVMDGAGNVLAFNGDITSSDQNAAIAFVAPSDGTFYLRISHDVASARAAGASPSAGYELSVKTFDLSAFDPLDAINWGGDENVVPGAADGEILVYFAKAGETFDGETSLGWTEYEQQQAMTAFQQYANVLPVTYRVTDDPALADFKLVIKTATEGDTPGVLGYFNPPGTDNAGVGVFWRDGFGWDENGPSEPNPEGDNGGLEVGGYGFYTLVHEFGHAMGLAHPHDTGGGSTVMAGVFGPFDAYGAFSLNQGVYTVMSYNPGWATNPDNDPYGVPWYVEGGVPYLEVDEAWNGTISALDVAVLQAKYGANTTFNSGDSTYVLPAANNGDAYYSVIWDAGGIDTIVHNGSQSATINLTAATLDYSATGGGVLSYADDVYGGFTIANNVMIENARGGSGNDRLLGNAGNNLLDGRGGVDVLVGGDGTDVLTGGDGGDIFVPEVGGSTVTLKGSQKGNMSLDIITDFDSGTGDDVIDLSGLEGNFHFNGTNANKNAGDVTYKSFTSISGAENALGFDIDGQPGAGGVGGPVTIVYINGDGGLPDTAIILLNTSSVDQADFIF